MKSTSSAERQSTKQKRKRTTTGTAEYPSASFDTLPGNQTNERRDMAQESIKDNNLPAGPILKRVRRESSESSLSAASIKANKNALPHSLPTTQTVAQTVAPSPTKSLKSYGKRNMKPPLSRRPASPDSEVDDGASIADSVMSTGRIRRTEQERQEYFKNEPECGVLEDHRVECLRCRKFVALGRRQKYTVRPWEIHRLRCDQKAPQLLSTGSTPNGQIGNEDRDRSDKNKSGVSPSDLVEQRKMALEADPNISALKPHEVLCRICGSWVRLSTKQAYKDSKWKTHTISCKEAPTTGSNKDYQPSTRVATATRKLQLVNDTQVKSFTARQVICAFCHKIIVSNGEEDFGISNWDLHKETCTSRSSESDTTALHKPNASTIPFPTKAPPSSASISTDDTIVASELNQALQRHGVNRPRENEDDVSASTCDPDSRPSNRSRVDAHQALAEEESASGWLMLPFRAFVRGFKESLKRT